MTKKKEVTPEEQAAIDQYVEAVDLFQRDPADLVEDPAAIVKIVQYLRDTRANVAAAEKAGKRITKKSATTPTTGDDVPVNPLDALAT
jgi:hypothetical protein